MATAITPLITNAGLAAAIDADTNSLQLAITHVALGSGRYTPAANRTALAARKEKASVSFGASSGPTSLVVTATFKGYTGTEYDLTEVGFYAGDPDAGGVLFAVAALPTGRFAVRNASVATYSPQFALQLSGVPSGSVTVTIDESGGIAEGLLAAHEDAANPHPQYLREDDGCPIGMVAYFDLDAVPPGWLAYHGQVVSRTQYAQLWAKQSARAISESSWSSQKSTYGVCGRYSVGDGSTTFRLPDTRGAFVRSANTSSSGVDNGRTLGNPQAQQTAKHQHVVPWGEAGGIPVFGGTTNRGKFGTSANDTDNYWFYTNDGTNYDGPLNDSGVIGDETRPLNVARLECVKAKRAT